MTGQELKDLREKYSITQRELAEKLGTTHPRVSDWETGKRKISSSYQKLIEMLFK